MADRVGIGFDAHPFAEGRPLRLAVDVDRIYVFDAESGEGRYA